MRCATVVQTLGMDNPIVQVSEAPSAKLAKKPIRAADPIPPLLGRVEGTYLQWGLHRDLRHSWQPATLTDEPRTAPATVMRTPSRPPTRSIPVARHLQMPSSSNKPAIGLQYKGLWYRFDPAGKGVNQLPLVVTSTADADEMEEIEMADTGRAAGGSHTNPHWHAERTDGRHCVSPATYVKHNHMDQTTPLRAKAGGNPGLAALRQRSSARRAFAARPVHSGWGTIAVNQSDVFGSRCSGVSYRSASFPPRPTPPAQAPAPLPPPRPEPQPEPSHGERQWHMRLVGLDGTTPGRAGGAGKNVGLSLCTVLSIEYPRL